MVSGHDEAAITSITGRAGLAQRIAQLVGGSLLQIDDPGTGWPTRGAMVVDGESVPIALFVGAVTLSHRGRDDVERRFQNPAQHRPITFEKNRHPLLLGLFDTDPKLKISEPLLVQADPHRRIGRTTRFSVFVSLASLLEASAKGWSEERSGSGELIRSLLPTLLPISVAAILSDTVPPSDAIQTAIEGSGLVDSPPSDAPAAAERARRVGMTLVRDARFSKRVITAYGGCCAMCGLGADFVQGAHIYPASAPGSVDEPWNGLALCANHHVAFDRHLVAVDPGSRLIIFSPELMAQAKRSDAIRDFVGRTFLHLREPSAPATRPHNEMFVERYKHFPGSYIWLAGFL